MVEFYDANGNKVILQFKQNAFPIQAKHVLVICRFGSNWILTNHRSRGIEFPGGKLEDDETVEEAACREVFEETGGVVKRIVNIGEYYIDDRHIGPFVKSVCYAEIAKMEEKKDYLETNGPVLKSDNMKNELMNSEYSFIMKDQVVTLALAEIENRDYFMNEGDL